MATVILKILTFTRYIKEAFDGFIKIKENSKEGISLGENTGLYYDFTSKAIIYINKKTKADMENADKFSKNFASVFTNWLQRLIITQVSKVKLSEEETKNFIRIIYNRLPKSDGTKFIQYLYSNDPTYYYYRNSDNGNIESGSMWGSIRKSLYDNDKWVFGVKYIENESLKQIFYKFIKANLTINELRSDEAYEVIQRFKKMGANL